MVAELKEVILKVEQLQDEEQKQIAKMLNDEIKWDTTLLNTQDKLSSLAGTKQSRHYQQAAKQLRELLRSGN